MCCLPILLQVIASNLEELHFLVLKEHYASIIYKTHKLHCTAYLKSLHLQFVVLNIRIVIEQLLDKYQPYL